MFPNGVKQQKIASDNVAVGMFVSGLDRPWTQTPFPLQGFLVRDQEDILKIQHYCEHVYIDVARGRGPVARKSTPPPEPEVRIRRFTVNRKGANKPKPIVCEPLQIQRDRYLIEAPLRKEVERAENINHQLRGALRGVTDSVLDGGLLTAEPVQIASKNMVDSIIRQPDAFAWLAWLEKRDQFAHDHGLRCAVWATLIGRQLGLRRSDMEVLATACLLKDVGRLKLSKGLLKPWQKLSSEEQQRAKVYIEHSIVMLRTLPDLHPKVIPVVRHHRERHDGSGFPQGITGDKIPLLARITGLVTDYDEHLFPSPKRSIPPSKVIADLYSNRGQEFQEELVVEFIKAVGLYPPGAVVLLNTGQVGVVVEQHPERRLRPKVMVLTDENRDPLKKWRLLDLWQDAVDYAGYVNQLSDKSRFKKALPFVEVVRDLDSRHSPADIETVLMSHLKKGWSWKSTLSKVTKFSAGGSDTEAG